MNRVTQAPPKHTEIVLNEVRNEKLGKTPS